MSKSKSLYVASALAAFITTAAVAQNPFITKQFTADPSARVFGDRVYVYPSHDIPCGPGRGRVGWFCMEDYHVFSSANLTNWTDHGVIVTQNKVPWVKPDSYSMWAPDYVFRNGKYYFYFPTTPRDTTMGKGFAIGVAVADRPTGPFVPQEKPIGQVHGIDPKVFIDKDKQAYLYWGNGSCKWVKLKDNVTELAGPINTFTPKNYIEGPWVYKRKKRYYLVYASAGTKPEMIEYCTAPTATGPWTYQGIIQENVPNSFTTHPGIIAYKGKSYFFYHNGALPTGGSYRRSICVDYLKYNPDSTIQKIIQTTEGVKPAK